MLPNDWVLKKKACPFWVLVEKSSIFHQKDVCKNSMITCATNFYHYAFWTVRYETSNRRPLSTEFWLYTCFTFTLGWEDRWVPWMSPTYVMPFSVIRNEFDENRDLTFFPSPGPVKQPKTQKLECFFYDNGARFELSTKMSATTAGRGRTQGLFG